MAYEHRVVPPVAVVAHGSGSCADFVARAFADPLREAGYGLVTFEDRTGDISVVTARLAALVDEHRAQLVGGVSLGAHAAVHVAASRPGLAGVLLVMPAWTGPPGTVAALSSLAAAELEVAGLPSVLERLRSTLGARRVIAGPYAEIDESHLADPRLAGELRTSVEAGREAVSRVLGIQPDSATLVVKHGARIPQPTALAALGVTRIVTSDAALAPAVPADASGSAAGTAAAEVVDQPVIFDQGTSDGASVQGMPLYVTDPVIEERLAKATGSADVNLAVQDALAVMAFRRLSYSGRGQRAIVVPVPVSLITSSGLDSLFEALSNHVLLRPVGVRYRGHADTLRRRDCAPRR